jgi:hypothetical protein
VILRGSDGSVRAFLIGGTGEDGGGKVNPDTPIESLVEEYTIQAATRSIKAEPLR